MCRRAVAPSSLAVPTQLRFLSLQGSALSGTLPDAATLSRFSFLDMSTNAISGYLPPFEPLVELEYLSLHTNQLSGTLSTGVGQMSALADRVYAHANRISGSLPSQLGDLTHVQLPTLHENALSGTIPTQLGLISQLSFPALSYNFLSGTVPSELALGWTTLEARLDLASNLITPIGEQAYTDAAIIRNRREALATSWYSEFERCKWRRQPEGRTSSRSCC